jgi:NADH-quinone oxidoreductase subunit J
MQVNADILILVLMIGAAVWTVMTRSLLRAAIGLAVTSAVVSVFMFRLDSPLAAVFELSVCSGLISVLFISTISITEPMVREEKLKHMQERFKRFKYLPLVLIAAAIMLSLIKFKPNCPLPQTAAPMDVRQVLWSGRPLEMIGQVIILLAGAFGVVILFKERSKK